MSRSSVFISGLFGSFLFSLGLCVILPQSQLAQVKPDFKEEDGLISDIYPSNSVGIAAAGREVYISQGCQACHSQMVRGSESADVARGWGARRTVARDYLFENPPVFGTARIGPDLANVGSPDWRNEPKDDVRRPVKRDAAWQYLHLYHPTAVVSSSNMPSYKSLFQLHKITGAPSPDALALPKGSDVPEGYELVPTQEAKSLVAYLNSLDRSHPLKEAGGAPTASKSK